MARSSKTPLKTEIEAVPDDRAGRLIGFLIGPGLMILILSALGIHLAVNGTLHDERANTAIYRTSGR